MRLPKAEKSIAEKSIPDAETSLNIISPKFSITRWLGSGLAVIPNLFRDLDFRFRNLVFKAPLCEQGSLLLRRKSYEMPGSGLEILETRGCL